MCEKVLYNQNTWKTFSGYTDTDNPPVHPLVHAKMFVKSNINEEMTNIWSKHISGLIQ